MSVEKATIAQLDDEPETVYALGINLDDFTDRELDDLLELLESRFDHAEWMVLNLPIVGSVEITEMDYDEVQEMIEFQNVVGDIDEPPYGVTDDG